jgi:hypothetical protein
VFDSTWIPVWDVGWVVDWRNWGVGGFVLLWVGVAVRCG